MKKAMIAVLVTMVSFAAGLAGMYLTMPQVAPDVVAEARPDSTAAPSSQVEPPASSQTIAQLPDSTSQSADSSMTQDMLDSLQAKQPSPQAITQTLRDSINALHTQLLSEREEKSALDEELANLQKKLSALQHEQARAKELSGTLAKLEIRELEEVIKQIDMQVLERLYNEASGRDRKRLLQALPPAQAARFVNKIVTEPSPSSR